jgi:hypothetical protein
MYSRGVTQGKKDAAPWPLTLIVHVGPHKTATTTIQAALAHNTPYLATRGVHVPPGVHPQLGGHHVLSFLLGGRSLVPLIGQTESDVSVGDVLDGWLAGARENGAHRVLVSSEEFCDITEEGWLAFNRELQEASRRTNTSVSNLVIHFTRRDIESRVKSAAGNAYIHGATLPREELIEWLRTDLARQDGTVGRIPELVSTPAEVSHIVFGDLVASPDVAPSQDFVPRWFAHVLGADNAEGIVIAEESSRLNPSLSAATLDELRAFNVLNNPPHAHGVWPFARFDGDPDLERAFARLNIVRFAFFARDDNEQVAHHLRVDVKNLEDDVQNLRAELSALTERSPRARIRRIVRG